MIARFLREGRTAVKIRSEHVARVFDVGTHEGVPFLVMELLAGEDLAMRIAREGALPIPVAVEFVLQACEALAVAHGLGVVHRDLKPSNLFIAEGPAGEPSVKVLDFGISKVIAAIDGPAVTTTSEVFGSPGFMSPEQMVATRDVDLRTDIWSMGMLLWEIVVGRSMFGKCTYPEICARVLGGNVVRARDSGVSMPEGLADAIDRCLAIEPRDRFPTVAALAEAIAPFGPPDAAARAARVLRVSRATSDRHGGTRSQDPPPLDPDAPTIRVPTEDALVPSGDTAPTQTATPVFTANDPGTAPASSVSAIAERPRAGKGRMAMVAAGCAIFALGALTFWLRAPSSIAPATSASSGAPVASIARSAEALSPSSPPSLAVSADMPSASASAPNTPPSSRAIAKGGAHAPAPSASASASRPNPSAPAPSAPPPPQSTSLPPNGAPILR
jgi:serine/threonine-protein kinase